MTRRFDWPGSDGLVDQSPDHRPERNRNAYRGRVFGAIGTTTTFIMFFGSAIAGFMADQIGTLVLVAAAATLYMLAGVLSPMAFGDSIKIASAQAEAQ